MYILTYYQLLLTSFLCNKLVYHFLSLPVTQGLGRKRFGREANIVNRDFLAWMPHKPDLERAGPQFSTYKGDFNTIEHQKLVGKIPSSFDNDNNEVTTYGYAYGTGNPNKPVINMMCNDRLLLPCTLEGTRPAPKPKWNSHGSVANCLVWHTPTPPLVKPVMMTMEASSEVAAPKPPSEKRPVTVHAMHCDYVSPPIIAA